MDNKELMFHCDTLQGNINRMIVTNNITDLHENYIYALHRLHTILIEREKEIATKEN